MKYKFIKTSNEKKKKKMIKMGFQLLSKYAEYYIFINDDSIQVEDTFKVEYTNTLMF